MVPMKKNHIRSGLTWASVVLLAFLLSGCETSRYTMKQDAGPVRSVSVDHIPDAQPRYEPRTLAGNKSPYKVLGKTYFVLNRPDNYREQGVASWYGKKFHGHLTSNGEIYNMYGMTAAHKTLPIPSYVKVTNRSNGRSVIVRVNDRGPFHGDRVIDLTYTAAKKLGFVDQGTARVMVEYIDPNAYQAPVKKIIATQPKSVNSKEPLAPAPVNPAGYEIPENTFLQVGAFIQRQSAVALQMKLSVLTHYPVAIYEPTSADIRDRFYRVRIGPLKDNLELLTLRDKLVAAALPEPHVVYQ